MHFLRDRISSLTPMMLTWLWYHRNFQTAVIVWNVSAGWLLFNSIRTLANTIITLNKMPILTIRCHVSMASLIMVSIHARLVYYSMLVQVLDTRGHLPFESESLRMEVDRFMILLPNAESGLAEWDVTRFAPGINISTLANEPRNIQHTRWYRKVWIDCDLRTFKHTTYKMVL